jgi:hypothetical protein
MGEKIVVGPITKGLRNDVTAFNVDNDAFPKLENAYTWRGRVKRKRGTSLLGRLTRFFDSTSKAFNPGNETQTLAATTGIGNLITGFTGSGIEANGQIVPGSVTITAPGPTVYTDPDEDGNLSPSGSINYSSGSIAIPAEEGNAISAAFNYFPVRPVMGLRNFVNPESAFPGTIAFDNKYAYNINTTHPFRNFSVSFYKNPSTSSFTNYDRKDVWTPLQWNGEDYQQFFTVNYQNALWAANGVTVPFDTDHIGMQFKPIISVTNITGGPPASARITLDVSGGAHNLVKGDFLFINEVAATTGINFQTGYVTSNDPQDPNFVVVTFPSATIATDGTGGIAQYLTNSSDPNKDCLRIYDGSPVTSLTPPVFEPNHGWVNFCPPLSLDAFSIADLPAAKYYLVGAKVIARFKDRILFFGPVVQTSSAGSQRYLKDTVIYSQNGTPYYTASFPYTTVQPSSSVLATANYTPILLPLNQTSTVSSFFEDLSGYGGYIEAGYDQAINTVVMNEDVLLVGFDQKQARFIYTGNDIVPFNFYVVNSELGSSSTFSAINLDRGALSVGPNGIIITSQNTAQRIDLDIPDELFQFNLKRNGFERVTAIRDFINEWIYFTYTFSGAPTNPDTGGNYFPNQTLFYNYRNATWAIFKESYTAYGTFRRVDGANWDDLTDFLWDDWTDDWDSGEQNLLQPEVIGGTPQGFILVKSENTAEGFSGFIKNISNSTITSPNHALREGDFIIIDNVIGTKSQFVNGKIFSVANPSTDTFNLNPTIPDVGTYRGNGTFKRMYKPNIQTKQFPVSWAMGRKTRIGVQQYLFTKTSQSQISLLIFLSQNSANAYNSGPIVPEPNSINNALIYSAILFTCPESENLGLTPANVNIQTPLAENQAQIWHRMNTSLIGDTVQIGFTLSDDQMRTFSKVLGTDVVITGATQADQCVITADNTFVVGQMVKIEDVEGMTELNGGIFQVVDRDDSSFTIDVDSTGFSSYTSEGTAFGVSTMFQFEEIELHSMILDVSPSQLLV